MPLSFGWLSCFLIASLHLSDGDSTSYRAPLFIGWNSLPLVVPLAGALASAIARCQTQSPPTNALLKQCHLCHTLFDLIVAFSCNTTSGYRLELYMTLRIACYRCQKLLAYKNCSQSLIRDHNTHAKKLPKTRVRLTLLPPILWRRATLCHHPLEDARKTHGRPHITPPQHSDQSGSRNIHYF